MKMVPSTSEISLCSSTSHKYGVNFNFSSRLSKRARPAPASGASSLLQSRHTQSHKEISSRQDYKKLDRAKGYKNQKNLNKYSATDKGISDLKHKVSLNRVTV